jgi:hypothetical protein
MKKKRQRHVNDNIRIGIWRHDTVIEVTEETFLNKGLNIV